MCVCVVKCESVGAGGARGRGLAAGVDDARHGEVVSTGSSGSSSISQRARRCPYASVVRVDDELELMVVPRLASYISLRSSAASSSGIAVRVMFEEVASRSQSSRRRRVAHLVMLLATHTSDF